MHKPDCACVMCRATQAAPRDRFAEFANWQAIFDAHEREREMERRFLAMRQLQQAPPSMSLGWDMTYPTAPPPPPPLPSADTMGPIRAWRLWTIKGERLWSVAHGVEWKPGVPMAGAPNQNNEAGVYAVKARDHGFQYRGDTILGEVGLWGRVIEHEHGYRAEYAYPIRLVWRAPAPMPGFPRPSGELRRLQALADVYGIPLTVEEPT